MQLIRDEFWLIKSFQAALTTLYNRINVSILHKLHTTVVKSRLQSKCLI